MDEVLQEEEVLLQDEEVDLDQVHQGLQLEVAREVILLHVLDLQQERKEEVSRDLLAEADLALTVVVLDQGIIPLLKRDLFWKIQVKSWE